MLQFLFVLHFVREKTLERFEVERSLDAKDDSKNDILMESTTNRVKNTVDVLKNHIVETSAVVYAQNIMDTSKKHIFETSPAIPGKNTDSNKPTILDVLQRNLIPKETDEGKFHIIHINI